jgi:short-subunit dehydrogenase
MPRMATRFRNVVITGASSGIGASLAVELAARGAEVVVCARRRDRLDDVVAKITAAGGKARAMALDVSDAEGTMAALQALDDELDGLDCVIANAGVGQGKPTLSCNFDYLRQIVDVNCRGAMATLLAVAPRMVDRRRGTLVGISSLAGYFGAPKYSVYSASKAFLSNFLAGLRLDLRGSGVRVVDVRPGFVDTEMTVRLKGKAPMMWDAERAARVIADGSEGGKRTIAFPFPVATTARLIGVLPSVVQDLAMGFGPAGAMDPNRKPPKG